MKRLALCAALAALVVAAFAGDSAGAKPAVERTCATSSKNVTTKQVKGTVVGTNVTSATAQYAHCPLVKSVMNQMLGSRAKKPTWWEGFYCRPSAGKKAGVVGYECVYRVVKPTVIKLDFVARYKTG